jgi:anaerobic ribonucleoside-triphosphate reductase/anaerobic ribonucleoside-triphosphate reductase activating protein
MVSNTENNQVCEIHELHEHQNKNTNESKEYKSEEHKKSSEKPEEINIEVKSIINKYVESQTWTAKENANSTYSLQGLMQHISNIAISEYWKKEIYTPEIQQIVNENKIHIHDLGFLSSYCSGWSIYDILANGFGGVENKLQCRPPNHLNTALNQIVNFLFTMQGELAGAQALSNFDTYIAPFIRNDNLSEADVFKYIQSFVYSLNVATRSGFQIPFTNITMDLNCPKNLKDHNVILGGRAHPTWVYGDFQEEMDMVNQAFAQVMVNGDGNGNIFSFPIPTYNISEDFDWSSKKNYLIWEMTAKYGTPYFANFVNSDLDPNDFRSMCCRLRLDLKKLHSRAGGRFASVPLTGSIGVVTVNLPNLAYRSKTKEEFLEMITEVLEISRDSLEIKRKIIEKSTEEGLYPYTKYYLKAVKDRTGHYWSNHFNTIGIIGMHEACEILFGEGIIERSDFAGEVLEFMKEHLHRFQQETEHLYNLEATPGESTCYKLAQTDRKLFTNAPYTYYTNSTNLPVSATDDLFEALDHQEKLQTQYTGGTVFHTFLGERLSTWTQARDLIKIITSKYQIPYVSLTPTFSICPTHGYINGDCKICPKRNCGKECLTYSRIVGYFRPVSDWNPGKVEEFQSRKCYKKMGLKLIRKISSMPNIRIGGFNKLTMTDYPDRIAAILFTAGCNMACGWCHNGDIARGVVDKNITVDSVLEYMQRSEYKNLVISGGEPTIQSELIPFLKVLKEKHISVKLDTNGMKPHIIKRIIDEHLVDFIAMDIKGPLEKYSTITGVNVNIDDIQKSIDLIKNSGIKHQFRTTVVPYLLDIEDIQTCKTMCNGDGVTLQKFRASTQNRNIEFQKHYEHTDEEFEKFT